MTTVRLSFDVSPELNETIERLADQLGCSKSSVLRKAIILAKICADAKSQGKKIGVAEKNQELCIEVVGL